MRALKQQNAALLIDLSNIVARAQAVAPLNHLELLLQMLLKLRRRYRHHKFVFALEGAGTLRRQRLLRGYKEGRVPSPEFNEARQQAIQMLKHINCWLIKAPDGEADDAIASYIAQNEGSYIVASNDRDLWQLIRPNVLVLATVKNSATEVDRFACRRLLGVDPHTVPLLKAMLGDPSDNIPRAIARVAKKKLVRLANDADGDVASLPEKATAAYLTKKDRERIRVAFTTVKQQLDVTKSWNNLPLRQRHFPGDAKALEGFLSSLGAECPEINTLVAIVGEGR